MWPSLHALQRIIPPNSAACSTCSGLRLTRCSVGSAGCKAQESCLGCKAQESCLGWVVAFLAGRTAAVAAAAVGLQRAKAGDRTPCCKHQPALSVPPCTLTPCFFLSRARSLSHKPGALPLPLSLSLALLLACSPTSLALSLRVAVWHSRLLSAVGRSSCVVAVPDRVAAHLDVCWMLRVWQDALAWDVP